MTIEELKENLEEFDAFEWGTQDSAHRKYEELRDMVYECNEPYLNRIVDDVCDFDDVQYRLADMAREDGPKAMENALRIWNGGWGYGDYFYIDDNMVYPFTICAVDELNEKLLKAIEEGGER